MKKIMIIITIALLASLPSFAGRRLVIHRHVAPGYITYAPTAVVRVVPNTGTIDINCNLDDAIVFVNGTRAGLADEFDGFPNKLTLKPGNYTIRIKTDSAQKTYRLYVTRGHEINLNVTF